VQAIETTLAVPPDVAEQAVRQALSEVGFGVLTEIDVAATLRSKLGVDRPALRILGACNPVLAHQSLQIDPSLALVLPCNVVVEDIGGGRTRVAVADPELLLGLTGSQDPRLDELGREGAAKLREALRRVAEQDATTAEAGSTIRTIG
jgi:uncharacterized protein (DUF302 family)